MQIDWERFNKILEGLPFTLNEKQIKACVEYINGNDHYLLISEAGGGKTLLINILKAYYKDEMVLCSSTGVGNQNLLDGRGGDGSAHRVWSIPFHLGDNIEKVKKPCSAIFSGSDLVKHVVIDEVFMLNSEALESLKQRIKRFNKRTKNRGERNIRLLIVGDPLQLPSVVREDNGDMKYLQDTYGSHKIYRSRLWDEFDFKVLMLEDVMRQGDKVFKAALSVLRYGQEERYEGVLNWLNRRINYGYDKDMFTVAAYKATVENVNKRVLATNKNPKRVYRAMVKDAFDLKENDVEKEIILCEGLECLVTVNDEFGEYFNGTLVRLTQLTSEGCYAKTVAEDKQVFIRLHEYKQEETYVEKDVLQDDGFRKDVLRKKEVGTCIQVPLVQASAITCHRAQGKTFNNQGVVDMGVKGFYEREGDYGCALLYVALSRFTDINNIQLPRKLHKGHIKIDRDAINFWFECKERSVI